MTNLKRVLSLMLVIALALSMVVMGTSAAKFSDVKSDYTYSTEVQFLSDLGILTGYSDGSYKPDGAVTRAEACAVVYRMLSGKTSAANYTGDTKFADVTAANWASGYVNFCVELGVVAGYPDGNFYPDKSLTYAEYVTMLVRALGLDTGKDPAYPFGYIALASVESVNADVDLQAADACNRGAVAKLTYNSILDATYARMANNIYVTEKPTIAKDVLKLEDEDGVLTSTGYYSFVDLPAAGEDNFTLSKFEASSSSETNGYTAEITGEFDVAASDLGKKATVWYKEDSTATNGKKIYAVITENSKEFNNIHVSLRGNYTSVTGGTPDQYEITYVVSDVDKTIKLDKDCQFIENNEFLYANNLNATDVDKTDDFYPMYARAWLPMSYRLIDNDTDGDYDFAIRTCYSFSEVTNITSSKITVDGQSAIDRQDDADNAYAWSDSLTDVETDDYVLWTCDGAVHSKTGKMPNYALSSVGSYAGPDFDNDLYDDTHNAKFIEIAKATGTVDSIVDGEKVVIGDKLYRTMRYGETDDLATVDLSGAGAVTEICAEIGDEFEYYPIASFAMIAKAEAVSTSSGEYLVITGIAKDSTIGNDFTISAIDENGDENTYTVSGDTTDNLTLTSGTEQGLTYANLNALVTAGHVFFDYTSNTAGEITSMEDFSTTAGDTIDDTDDSYSTTSGLLNTTDSSYLVTDSTLVYVMNGGGSYKVYVGGYPTINGNATTTICGLDTTSSSGTDKLRALYIETTDTSISGTSDNEDLAGYLKSVTVTETDGEWCYTYAIWYDGELKTYTSATVDDDSDLSDLETDDGNIANAVNLGGVVIFDINTDGTVSNMTIPKQSVNFTNTYAADSVNDGYYGTCIVTNTDTSNKLITVVPLLNNGSTKVSAGATLKVSNGNYRLVSISDVKLGTPKTYAYNSDTNVYEFDVTSTNQAYAEVSNVGAITESDSTLTVGDEIYLVSFRYDDDDDADVITDIFFNGKSVTITAATTNPFTAQTDSSTANTVAALGLVGTTATSSATGVATAAISGGNIAITSVAAGSATITVSDGTNSATIAVTVSSTGEVAIGTITPYVSPTGVSASATVVGTALGATSYRITLTNAVAADVTSVLVNGDSKTFTTEAAGTLRVTSTSAVTSMQIVVSGTTYTVTLP